MKALVFLACALIALPALAQAPRINAKRAAYGYEIIDTIPGSVLLDADRSEIARFLAERQVVKSDYINSVRRACTPFLQGDLSIRQFAATFDSEVAKRNDALSSAYEHMSARLSAPGLSSLQDAVTKYDWQSADLVATDVLAAAPVEAERLFTVLCNKATAGPAP